MMDRLLAAVLMPWWAFWVIVVGLLGIITWAWYVDVTNAQKAADLRRRRMGCPK